MRVLPKVRCDCDLRSGLTLNPSSRRRSSSRCCSNFPCSCSPGGLGRSSACLKTPRLDRPSLAPWGLFPHTSVLREVGIWSLSLSYDQHVVNERMRECALVLCADGVVPVDRFRCKHPRLSPALSVVRRAASTTAPARRA